MRVKKKILASMQFKFDGVLKDVEQDEVYEVRGMWVLTSEVTDY